MRSTRRLRRLEAAAPNREPDRHDQWVYDLCQGSPLLGAITSAAEQRARRREFHEGRWPEREQWRRLPNLDALAQIERAELLRSWEAVDDLWQAIESWVTEPDRLGWPTPKTSEDHPRSDLEAFYVTLRSRRQVVESNRTIGGAGAARWRQDNPEWRPHMPDDEYFAWDIDRLGRAAREGRW